MSTEYESFLRDRWEQVSHDAARAEALLELVLESEDVADSLRRQINRFLELRRTRRAEARARIAALGEPQ